MRRSNTASQWAFKVHHVPSFLRNKSLRPIIAIAVFCIYLLWRLMAMSGSRSPQDGVDSAREATSRAVKSHDFGSNPLLETSTAEKGTLVLYVFSRTDVQYYQNLLYFVTYGIPGCDACEYIIAINGKTDTADVNLPKLPANGKYVFHRNECYDWGTFGWIIKTEDIDISAYKYFVFLNSSVRGPFMPTYLKGRMHFTEAMTSKLTRDVKLVGPTINCEGTATLATGERRENPHVQSFAVATDAVGMELLVRDGKVFGCYSAFQDTIYYSELGSSAVILNAGYNLDSFMGRYQGVDWRDQKVWGCNAGQNPFNEARVDSVTLAPMELMFVKVKQNMLLLNYPSALAAIVYDAWEQDSATGSQRVLDSLLGGQDWEVRAPHILQMAAIGIDCFDCSYYLEHNTDLVALTCWQAFSHFINFGQFEMRSHRLTCDKALEGKAVPYMPADIGERWPRPVTSGCDCGKPLNDREALQARLQQVQAEVQALREQIFGMTNTAGPGGDLNL